MLQGAPVRMLARDDRVAQVVELDESRRARATLSELQTLALACMAMLEGFRGPLVRKIVDGLASAFAAESRQHMSRIEYQPDAAGVSVKDVGSGGGTVVIGDQALSRVARGAIEGVGQELRGAVRALAAVDFSAKRAAIVWIGGERVRVASEAEAKEAERIVTKLKDDYGVTFDSVAARHDMRKDKAERGWSEADVRAIDVEPWTLMDLKDLEAGFKYFAPVIGKGRSKSARAGTRQELERLGRVNLVKEKNEGRYLEDTRTVAVLQSHPPVIVDTDESTAVHEIAHAVFGPRVEDFKKRFKYWTDRHRGFEAPPTDHGATNPDEDMAESVTLFFTAPDALKQGQRGKKRGEVGNPCRERFAWVAAEVAAWTPKR
jgi:hypothetical protein